MLFSPVYLILAVFVLGMNVVPVFMPPTWLVLAFFFSRFHLNLFATVLIGAISATCGRVLLYHLARLYLRPFLPKKFEQNYDYLGSYIQKRQNLTIPIVITYAFLPIPSNDVFIIAGLTGLKIKIIAFSFFVGRLISYSFWISLAYHLSNRLEMVFAEHFSNLAGIAAELLGFGIILLVGKINWRKILRV